MWCGGIPGKPEAVCLLSSGSGSIVQLRDTLKAPTQAIAECDRRSVLAV
jgi:hypothetical protein